MSYQGTRIQLSVNDNIAELCFNNEEGSVNKFDLRHAYQLREVTDKLKADSTIQGLMVTSGKRDFIVGADITEFGEIFKGTEEQLIGWMKDANAIFNDIEDLPFPSVSVIGGTALGGGFEMALSTDYRILSKTGSVGLPEIKLGICPGFGGTVRLPRLVGADNAIEAIAAAKTLRPDAAFKMGAVDAVVEQDGLKAGGLKILQSAIAGELDYQARRAQKKGPLKLGMLEQMMCFTTAKGFIAGQAGPHYPAPVQAVKIIERGASQGRDGALKAEEQGLCEARQNHSSRLVDRSFPKRPTHQKEEQRLRQNCRRCGTSSRLGRRHHGGWYCLPVREQKDPHHHEGYQRSRARPWTDGSE